MTIRMPLFARKFIGDAGLVSVEELRERRRRLAEDLAEVDDAIRKATEAGPSRAWTARVVPDDGSGRGRPLKRFVERT